MNGGDEILLRITKYLNESYDPEKLLIYGSRAQNTHNQDSDYDFVMVLSDSKNFNRLDLMAQIKSELFNLLGVEVQVWAYTISQFDILKEEFSSIPETALSTGKEIPLG